MGKGRKPLPIELHRMLGTYRANRHSGVGPELPRKVPTSPKHLDKAAKVEYSRTAKLLARCRIITDADRAALACYAQAWSRMVDAENKLRITGLILKGPNGVVYQSPFLAIANRAGAEVRKWAAELGLTPAARCKLRVDMEAPLRVDARDRNAGCRVVG